MPRNQSSILRRTLPLTTFNRLRLAFEQMAQSIGEGSLLLTEDVVSSVSYSKGTLAERFTVLVSERFSALLLGTELLELGELDWQDPQRNFYQVSLNFEPEAIAAFVTQLGNVLENHPVAIESLQQASLKLQPNDSRLQSEFTLLLLEILTLDGTENPTPETGYPYVSVCQPVHEALHQQVEQERLLNQVATQIRQSLELPVILKTAVEQVRSFLQVDRLLIYQFEKFWNQKANGGSQSNSSPSSQHTQNSTLTTSVGWGRVTYEARASETVTSVLHFAEEDRCFLHVPECREKYRKGFVLAVGDIETAYTFSPCLLEMLRRTQVRAKLVIPIVVQEELWGLLIAHQCFEAHPWQESEKKFLGQIGEHLAIAIYQAQLYAQLQQQKQTLEERVIERTQELHDALLAAQSANRAKGEFLATMSHELRTPLTCVIGLSATMLRWSFGQLTQKQRDYLQIIHDNGEHLLELINDILDLSKLEAGKTVLKIREFSLSQLVHESLQTLKEKAAQRGVELAMAVRIEPHQDRFSADPRRVKQILLNLLSNAIKFTPKDGRVILRAWMEGKTAVFQVEDTGIGIPEHQIHLLFQKFQQLDTSYQRQYEGTGLGLALTKQLVELHGGRIEVESTVDVGSTFTVWLPPPPSSAINAATSGVDLYETPQGRIALIADHEESATLICDILTAAGYQIVWIIQGSTAVKQIEILQPLVAIVDVELSGMHGYEVMQELRNLPATQDLKILALTPVEILENQSKTLSLEADDYLTKPLQPEELLQKVAALIVAQVPSACIIPHS